MHPRTQAQAQQQKHLGSARHRRPRRQGSAHPARTARAISANQPPPGPHACPNHDLLFRPAPCPHPFHPPLPTNPRFSHYTLFWHRLSEPLDMTGRPDLSIPGTRTMQPAYPSTSAIFPCSRKRGSSHLEMADHDRVAMADDRSALCESSSRDKRFHVAARCAPTPLHSPTLLPSQATDTVTPVSLAHLDACLTPDRVYALREDYTPPRQPPSSLPAWSSAAAEPRPRPSSCPTSESLAKPALKLPPAQRDNPSQRDAPQRLTPPEVGLTSFSSLGSYPGIIT